MLFLDAEPLAAGLVRTSAVQFDHLPLAVERTSSPLLERLLEDHNPVCAFQFKGCPRQAVANGFLATKPDAAGVLGGLSGHTYHSEIVSPISEPDSSTLCYPDDDGRVRFVFLPDFQNAPGQPRYPRTGHPVCVK